ncbi:hypothetical protein CU048_00465 [Beijerinckiaceae bacterium]|nr:hypothetical protein CU048_00465 [Beijerinckiaceae bacterium]
MAQTEDKREDELAQSSEAGATVKAVTAPVETSAPRGASKKTSSAAPQEKTPAGRSEPAIAKPVEVSEAHLIEEAVAEEIDTLQKLSDKQLDAAVSVANSFTESLQQLTAEATDYSKKYFDNGAVFMKTLLGARSLSTIVEVQTSYTETAYANYLAHLVKMGDLYRSLLEAAATKTGIARPR